MQGFYFLIIINYKTHGSGCTPYKSSGMAIILIMTGRNEGQSDFVLLFLRIFFSNDSYKKLKNLVKERNRYEYNQNLV